MFDTIFRMRMAEALVPEFDREMANVRKTLERIPDDKMDFVPHAKSTRMGNLANHIADIPAWTIVTFEKESLDVSGWISEKKATTEEILAMFDRNVANARGMLSNISDEVASGTWSLTGQGATYFTSPKMEVIRTWVLNHIIHHRAQMGVYLRLLDIPVPGIYGPSADEM